MIRSLQYEFYYDMMPVEEQRIYRTMYDNFIQHKRVFNVNKCDVGLLAKVYEKVLLDHPELFYLIDMEIEMRYLGGGYKIRPRYRFSEVEVRDITYAVNEQVKEIVLCCIGKTEQEKEQIIHDFIVSNVTYKDAEAAYSHEMLGVLLYGIGVCEGISKAFKYLCDLLGIKSGIVVGKTKGESVAHAWNIILIDKKWYNIDVTFDANLSVKAGEIRYDYFNVADEELVDRSSYDEVPPCNSYYEYYKKQNMYAGTQRILRQLIKNRDRQIFSVQLPHIACSKEQLESYIFQAVNDSVMGQGSAEVTICSNYDMNVFTIRIEARR